MRDSFLSFLSLGISKQKTELENKQNKTKTADLLPHPPTLQKGIKEEEWSHETISTCLNSPVREEKKAKRNHDWLLGGNIEWGGDVRKFSATSWAACVRVSS